MRVPKLSPNDFDFVDEGWGLQADIFLKYIPEASEAGE